ncbi:Hypothetical predicted protein [Cloeon dipterum]|uniref:Uncharacterized protein n=1 Tax=Cloeon dipterum TaxID=197152 RepID=A0A8S1CBE3_9INSE|nr:Hypothetical predicted protein [Cloeon dipterum]
MHPRDIRTKGKLTGGHEHELLVGVVGVVVAEGGAGGGVAHASVMAGVGVHAGVVIAMLGGTRELRAMKAAAALTLS